MPAAASNKPTVCDFSMRSNPVLFLVRHSLILKFFEMKGLASNSPPAGAGCARISGNCQRYWISQRLLTKHVALAHQYEPLACFQTLRVFWSCRGAASSEELWPLAASARTLSSKNQASLEVASSASNSLHTSIPTVGKPQDVASGIGAPALR